MKCAYRARSIFFLFSLIALSFCVLASSGTQELLNTDATDSRLHESTFTAPYPENFYSVSYAKNICRLTHFIKGMRAADDYLLDEQQQKEWHRLDRLEIEAHDLTLRQTQSTLLSNLEAVGRLIIKTADASQDESFRLILDQHPLCVQVLEIVGAASLDKNFTVTIEEPSTHKLKIHELDADSGVRLSRRAYNNQVHAMIKNKGNTTFCYLVEGEDQGILLEKGMALVHTQGKFQTSSLQGMEQSVMFLEGRDAKLYLRKFVRSQDCTLMITPDDLDETGNLITRTPLPQKDFIIIQQ